MRQFFSCFFLNLRSWLKISMRFSLPNSASKSSSNYFRVAQIKNHKRQIKCNLLSGSSVTQIEYLRRRARRRWRAEDGSSPLRSVTFAASVARVAFSISASRGFSCMIARLKVKKKNTISTINMAKNFLLKNNKRTVLQITKDWQNP